jgi:Tfp pilus assembly protein PilX
MEGYEIGCVSTKPKATTEIIMKTIQVIYDEKGIALATTLILALVCLTLIAGVVTMLNIGTRISGIKARYTSSLEAAKGGIEDFLQTIPFSHKGLPTDTDYKCKLQQDTSNWNVTCLHHCSDAYCTSHSSPRDIIDFSDWSNVYGNYTVYCKIVDAKGTSEGDWFYTIEAVAIGNNTSEIAWFTVVYKRSD